MKNDIKYAGKSYQVSTIELQWGYETMIFPIIAGIISGDEIYKYRTCIKTGAINKHFDILKYPEKYVDDKAIEAYKESLKEDTDISKFKNFFDEMKIKYSYRECERTNRAILEIDEEHIYMSYGNAIAINFELNTGKFVEFEAWGE